MPGNIGRPREVQRRIERSINVVPIYQLRFRSGFLDTAHVDQREVLEARG